MDNKTVKDFMTSQVATLSPGCAITDAVRELLKHRQSAAAVVDDDKNLVGLISEADCMKATITKTIYPDTVNSVSEQMTKEVQSISSDTSMLSAAELMLNHKRRMIPVADNGKYVGILTRHDILRALLESIDKPMFS